MKKFLALLSASLLLGSFCNYVKAMTYEEALAQSKPIAILVYADWAEQSKTMLPVFNAFGQRYAETYNFVELNIADKQTKAFNQKYHIYPNLPYVLLFKEGGKISRYLKADCVMDDACFAEKLDFFNN